MFLHKESKKEKEGRNDRKKETAIGSETKIKSKKKEQK